MLMSQSNDHAEEGTVLVIMYMYTVYIELQIYPTSYLSLFLLLSPLASI